MKYLFRKILLATSIISFFHIGFGQIKEENWKDRAKNFYNNYYNKIWGTTASLSGVYYLYNKYKPNGNLRVVSQTVKPGHSRAHSSILSGHN